MGCVLGALPRVALLIRWTARVWGTTAAVLLLAFLVEHFEWFRGDGLPPTWVTIAVGLQLLALIGLIVAWRWEALGACITLVAAAGFMLAVGGGWRLAPIMGFVSMPAVLWLCSRWLRQRSD
jgi:hypothetical protein